MRGRNRKLKHCGLGRCRLRRHRRWRRPICLPETIFRRPYGWAVATCACSPAPVRNVGFVSAPAPLGTLRTEYNWIPYVEDPAADGVGTGAVGLSIAESLVWVGEDGAPRPQLVKSWESNDVTTEWTLHLQEGVTFNNGKPFGTDDVIWNIKHWLNPSASKFFRFVTEQTSRDDASNDLAAPGCRNATEDDHDNQYVYNVVVDLLRRRKFSRQVIIATHNANIPVNGDAELIVALGTNARLGKVLGSGSIDQAEIKDLVSVIMEGSAEAFRLRRERYGY